MGEQLATGLSSLLRPRLLWSRQRLLQMGLGSLGDDGWHRVHSWAYRLHAVYSHWHLRGHQVQHCQVQVLLTGHQV